MTTEYHYIDQNEYMYHTAGLPSLPVITQAITGVKSVILTVQLYVGHSSLLLLNVTATNQTGGNITFANLLQSGTVEDITEYSVQLPLPPGIYHFTVHASNLFGNTVRSKVFPLIHGIEGWSINVLLVAIIATEPYYQIYQDVCLSIQSSYSYGH